MVRGQALGCLKFELGKSAKSQLWSSFSSPTRSLYSLHQSGDAVARCRWSPLPSAARFIGAAEEMERTQSQLNKLEQQRRSFEQWQTSPQTQEMERLRDYLNTKEVQNRLREIQAKAREYSRQQKPEKEMGRGLSL